MIGDEPHAARFTQADIARSIRAAKQAGATGVELRPDGSIFIHLSPSPAEDQPELLDQDDLEANDGRRRGVAADRNQLASNTVA
jgi:hypothetical protein